MLAGAISMGVEPWRAKEARSSTGEMLSNSLPTSSVIRGLRPVCLCFMKTVVFSSVLDSLKVITGGKGARGEKK